MMLHSRRRFLASLGATAAASAAWTGGLSTLFGPGDSLLSGDPEAPMIAGLLERQRRLWHPDGDRSALTQMRRLNPEWDFMGRTFAALSMITAIRRKPELAASLKPSLDFLTDQTIAELQEMGSRHFLLSYGYQFLNPARTSLFVDGELLCVLASREALFGDGRHRDTQEWLAARVRQNMDAGPLGHGESYGNECWAFCNAFAALGLQRDEKTSGRSHKEAVERYLVNLPISQPSGLIQSEYTYDGSPLDGPEGSSLFLVTTLLEQVAPGRGRSQYVAGRTALHRRFLGFGYAREWAPGVTGHPDIDSGPIVPIFEASPAASGLAIIAAAAFDDRDTLSSLLASVKATAFPTWQDGALLFAASNAVGDAAILFGLLRGADDTRGAHT